MRACLTVSSYDLQVGEFVLDVFDHVDLEDGVALRRVLQRQARHHRQHQEITG